MGLLLGKLPLNEFGRIGYLRVVRPAYVLHSDSHAPLPNARHSIDDDDKPSNLAPNLGLLHSVSLLQHDAE